MDRKLDIKAFFAIIGTLTMMPLGEYLMKSLLMSMLAMALVPSSLYAVPVTTNLLSNPGAESGSIVGWTAVGPGSPTVDSGSFNSGINPHSGNFDFLGHDSASDSLYQTVSLLTQGVTGGMIDSGASVELSFWEQGLNQGTPSDDAAVMLTFLNSLGASIGSVSSGFVDSHTGAWTNYSNSFVLPSGTRSVTYTMEFNRNVGSDLDAYIDDNSLTVSINTPSASPVPEPGTFTMLVTGAVGLLGFVRRRTRFR